MKKIWEYPGVDILLIFLGCILAYKLAGFLLCTPHPLNVVVSPSMNPTLNEGDLVIAYGCSNYSLGDIIFYIPNEYYRKLGINKPILHRIVAEINIENKTEKYWEGIYSLPPSQRQKIFDLAKKVLEDKNIKRFTSYKIVYLVKGDNNKMPDNMPVFREQILGKVLFRIPYLAYPRYLIYKLFGV